MKWGRSAGRIVLFVALGISWAPVRARAAEIIFGTGEIEIVQTEPAPVRRPAGRPSSAEGETRPRGPGTGTGVSYTITTPGTGISYGWLSPYLKATRFQYGLRVSTYDVDGANARSFRPEGGQHEQDLSIMNRARFDDGRTLEWKADLRRADDRQVTSRRDVTLQGLYMTYAKPNNYDIRFGDVFANFSRYSLTRSFEGLTASWIPQVEDFSGLKFSVASGRTTRAIDGRSFQRYVNGVKAAWSGIDFGMDLIRPISLGLNIAAANDDQASAIGVSSALDARVKSLDWSIPLSVGNTVIDGEIVRTDVNPNGLDPASRVRVGTAWRWGLRGTPRPGWNIGANVERADPDVQNPVGSVPSDQFRWDVSAQGRLPMEAQLGLQFLRSENNVTNRLPSTNISHIFGANLSVPFLKSILAGTSAPLARLREMQFTAGWRLSDRYSTDRRFDNTAEDQNFGVSHSLGPYRYAFGYNFQTSLDRVTRANDRRSMGWNASLSREIALERLSLVLSPAFTYSRNRDHGDLARSTNRNQSANFNLGLRWRDRLSGGLSYSISDRNLALGANDAVQTSLAANVAWRIVAPINGQISLSARQNRIKDEQPGQSYSEKEGQVTFNAAF